MAIQLYTGMTGSGKSYNALANIIVPALKDGRTVVTNVPLRLSSLFADIETGAILPLPQDMTSDTVVDYLKHSNYPPGSVYVIDEAFSLFPSGQKANNVPESLREFFSMHRHVVSVDGKASDIYLMAQNYQQLASWIRQLISSMTVHTNLKATGLDKKFRADFYQFELDGQRVKDRLVRSDIGSIKEPYINYYVSNSRSDAGMQGDVYDKSVDTRSSLFLTHKKNLMIAGIAGIFSFGFVGYSIYDFASMGSAAPENQEQESEEAPPEKTEKKKESQFKAVGKTSQIAQQTGFRFPIRDYVQPAFQRLPESKEWRLTGVIKSPRKSYALISSVTETLRLSLLQNCYYSGHLDQWVCWYQDAMVAQHTGPDLKQELTDSPLNDAFPGYEL